MRIPLSWLREYTELPAQATAEDVMADLVKVGLEEEAVHRPSDGISGPIVVGKVLSFEVEPQKNGKNIRWCQVQVGPDSVNGIVCGAQNFKEGDLVVVTLPGAELPGGFKISPRKTYGHVSDGMMAASTELGLPELEDGIIRLNERGIHAEVGQDALPLLGMDDEAAEVNVTPDRSYCFSIRGIAREYSHATNTTFNDPADTVQATVDAKEQSGLSLNLHDEAPIRGKDGCTQFIARTIEGVNAQATTPEWMSNRLNLAGVRPISVLVDITNYVMLELGQPMHAYDADKLHGGITVRRAQKGEKIITLDDQERKLDPEDLVIADEAEVIGIAGVMGGAHTEVTQDTKNIVLEAASFDPVSIARAARRHKLPSEASKRFERGVDTQVTAKAIARATDLVLELAGGKVAGTTTVGEPETFKAIKLPTDYVNKRIGINYSDEEVIAPLEKLGATVKKGSDGYEVTPPSWRPDLVDDSALSEEVVRLNGYEHIPSRVPQAPAGKGMTRTQQLRRRAADTLASSGLIEVKSYPFVSQEHKDLFGAADSSTKVSAIKLKNPLNSELPYMTPSLLPGLLEVAHRNISRGQKDLALFQKSMVFLPVNSAKVEQLPSAAAKPSDEEISALNAALPDQPHYISGLLAGEEMPAMPHYEPRLFDYSDALSIVQTLANALAVDIDVSQGEHQAFHPGRTAVLTLNDELMSEDGHSHIIGYAGELHPQIIKDNNLPEHTAVFELNLDAFIDHAPDVIFAKPLSTYPAATQDVALLVDADTSAQEVLEALRSGAGDMLEEIRLFDEYTGDNVDDAKKSLAFTMKFRAPDRTLTAEEASEARDEAVKVAQDYFGAVQR
ncbi:MAG: phenylalanine--tRNA ligase subunit beta [Micrococcaceae bacterium]